jgi:hypothetical protein
MSFLVIVILVADAVVIAAVVYAKAHPKSAVAADVTKVEADVKSAEATVAADASKVEAKL